MKRIDYNELVFYTNKILQKYNVKKNQSEIIANNLVLSDAYGIHTHGLSVLKGHIQRIIRGGYNLVEEPIIVKQTPSFAVVDGNNTIGLYSAQMCMNLALEKCQDSGIYFVFSQHSNTFGPAFLYSKMATDKMKVGICFSNSPANMPPTGGMSKLLGTNPLSVGIPGLKKGPIIFDMATSIVAKSKISEAKRNNRPIPLGWAIDKNGIATTDPDEAIRGMVLPMAEHKGYGLAMVIDILSGVISNSGYLNNVNRFYSDDNSSMNVGQTFIAINPTLIDSDDFYKKIDDYIEKLKNSKKLNDNEIFFPGEIENNKFFISKKLGVDISDDVSTFFESELGRSIDE